MQFTLQDIDPADWLNLSLHFRDLTFEQTRAYAQPAADRIGGRARFLACRLGDQPIALAAVRQRNLPGLRRGIVWLPAGPLFLRDGAEDPDDSQITGILQALRQRLVQEEGNILRLRLSALSFLDAQRADAIAATAGFRKTARAPAYKTFALDTRLNDDDALRRLHGKWRGHLRNAFKADLTVEHASDHSLDARFDKVYASVQDAKGFTTTITPEFHRRCRGEGYHLETFIVTREGRDVSAGMIVVTGQNANYLFGATNAEGREHRSGYQLTWSIMCHCHATGLHWMDLGGVDDQSTPELTVYKERTGALYAEGAGPYEAAPGGLFTPTVHLLENLRARRKGRGA